MQTALGAHTRTRRTWSRACGSWSRRSQRTASNVALRIADYIGPQPAKDIADIAREVGGDMDVVRAAG